MLNCVKVDEKKKMYLKKILPQGHKETSCCVMFGKGKLG